MTFTSYRNTRWVILLVLLFVASNSANAKESDIEKAGDVLMIFIPGIAYGTTYFLDDEDGRGQFYKSFFTNLGITYALKFSIDKERPDGSGSDSFPSGHTSIAFQGAAFIQKRYSWKYAIPAYVGATFVGYSRVYADKHYVEDVVVSAAIGILSSYCFVTSYKGVNITPVAGNGFNGINISKKW